MGGNRATLPFQYSSLQIPQETYRGGVNSEGITLTDLPLKLIMIIFQMQITSTQQVQRKKLTRQSCTLLKYMSVEPLQLHRAFECDLVILVVDSISQHDRSGLESAGWKIQRFQRIRNPKAKPNAYNEWNYSKFRLWQLTESNNIIFIDADMLILRNIDFLFEFPEISATRWWRVHNAMPEKLQRFCLLRSKQKAQLEWDRRQAGKGNYRDGHWKIKIKDKRLETCFENLCYWEIMLWHWGETNTTVKSSTTASSPPHKAASKAFL